MNEFSLAFFKYILYKPNVLGFHISTSIVQWFLHSVAIIWREKGHASSSLCNRMLLIVIIAFSGIVMCRFTSLYTQRTLHKCLCLTEFIKLVEEKRNKARLAEHFISFSKRV